MEDEYCQSCGMPMGATNGMYGTNADATKNSDYCKFCFENGVFAVNCTMDEMIEFCVPHMTNNNAGMSTDEARKMMRVFFPTLKRWKQN